MKYIKDLIVEELKEDSELRLIHLQDAIASFFSGDVRTCLLMLRNIVNATCGFSTIASKTGISDKSLMRMLSDTGNPKTENLCQIISFLLTQENVGDFELKRKTA